MKKIAFVLLFLVFLTGFTMNDVDWNDYRTAIPVLESSLDLKADDWSEELGNEKRTIVFMDDDEQLHAFFDSDFETGRIGKIIFINPNELNVTHFSNQLGITLPKEWSQLLANPDELEDGEYLLEKYDNKLVVGFTRAHNGDLSMMFTSLKDYLKNN